MRDADYDPYTGTGTPTYTSGPYQGHDDIL